MPHILTLNCGSSSIKAAIYDGDVRIASALLERIGLEVGSLRVTDRDGHDLANKQMRLPDHESALNLLFESLPSQDFGAVGHRIVHGGPKYREHQRVTADMIAELRRIVSFVPLHLPAEIAAIEAVGRRLPNTPQIACFDTAFHRTLPDVARILPLPLHFADGGIFRYGFHGLSYESIVEQLTRDLPRRLIVAHLGNGCSMAAIRDGRSIDTTMSFTPTAGLMMGTRSGDLDPGLIIHLFRERGLTVADVDQLINRESGLLGISGVSSDVREIEASTDSRANLALEMFAYEARKHLGALTTSLDGLDALVFTGGIGEHSASLRSAICSSLGYLGIDLDPDRNKHHAAVISKGSVTVRVMKTDEEGMIARHARKLQLQS